jgi:hypothetical protein
MPELQTYEGPIEVTEAQARKLALLERKARERRTTALARGDDATADDWRRAHDMNMRADQYRESLIRLNG